MINNNNIIDEEIKIKLEKLERMNQAQKKANQTYYNKNKDKLKEKRQEKYCELKSKPEELKEFLNKKNSYYEKMKNNPEFMQKRRDIALNNYYIRKNKLMSVN